MPRLSPTSRLRTKLSVCSSSARVVASVLCHFSKIVERGREGALVAQVAEERQRLFVKPPRALVVAAVFRHVAQVVEHVGDGQAVVYLFEEGECLFVTRGRLLVIALLVRHVAEPVERRGHAPLVSDLLVERQSLLKERQRLLVVAVISFERPGPGESLGAHGRRRVFAGRQKPEQPVAPLRLVAAHLPEPPQRPGQTQGQFRFPALAKP